MMAVSKKIKFTLKQFTPKNPIDKMKLNSSILSTLMIFFAKIKFILYNFTPQSAASADRKTPVLEDFLKTSGY